MVGIIAAMEAEENKFIPMLSDAKTKEIFGIRFTSGKIGNAAVVVARSGVGKVAAALTAGLLVQNFDVALLISTGVAGGLGGLRALDLCLADSLVQHDFNLTPLGEAAVFYTASEKYNALFKKVNPHVKTGVVATGDCFVVSGEQSRLIRESFGAIACDMESAAIAQVAAICGKDFMAVRAISDAEGANRIGSFAEFTEQAATLSAQAVGRFLREIG
jgi:adenosylhomocysteine nucleosidase